MALFGELLIGEAVLVLERRHLLLMTIHTEMIFTDWSCLVLLYWSLDCLVEQLVPKRMV